MAAKQNPVVFGLPGDEEIFADKDHSDIVKFASKTDQTYVDIVARIKMVLEEVGTIEQGVISAQSSRDSS